MRHARGTTAAGIGLGFKLSVASPLQGFGRRPVSEVRPAAFIDAALGRRRIPLFTRTQLGPNHTFLSVLIRKHKLGRRAENHGS